jgi:hypothetical protein
VKKLITASLVALLSLSAVPAAAQVDEWHIMAQRSQRSHTRVEVSPITGRVDQVVFQAGYPRITGYFRYNAHVYCDDGQTWSEKGLARDRRNRYWESRVFSLGSVPSNVPCHAWLEVRATRSLRGYKVYGAIWGHFYTT